MLKKILLEFLRDLVIFLMGFYCVLIIVNVFLQDFVRSIFPLDILGWLVLGALVVYYLLAKNQKPDSHIHLS